MEENVRLFFTATNGELKNTCSTLENRVSLATAAIENDTYISALDEETKENLMKALVACLHIAYQNDADVDMEIEENERTAYVCLRSKNFIFLHKESISLTFLITQAKGIELVSEEDGLVSLYFDFSI